MGAWGTGIEDGDTVLDILDTFLAALRTTQDVAAASDVVRRELEHYFAGNADADARAHARLGLALAQWRYGALQSALLDEVRADLAARHGIDSYNDAAARAKAVNRFVAKLEHPNPKPRALPKAPKRPRKARLAAFDAGDCLALQMPSGSYRAALVLVRDTSVDGDEFNVIARLDWQGAKPPTPEVFATPRVRHTAMYPWGPYKGKARVTVLQRTDIDTTHFGIEKMPAYWPWQFVRADASPRPMSWLAWDDLAGALP